jgi:hypothetical protein
MKLSNWWIHEANAYVSYLRLTRGEKDEKTHIARLTQHHDLESCVAAAFPRRSVLLFIILNTLPHAMALTESVSTLRQVISDSRGGGQEEYQGV